MAVGCEVELNTLIGVHMALQLHQWLLVVAHVPLQDLIALASSTEQMPLPVAKLSIAQLCDAALVPSQREERTLLVATPQVKVLDVAMPVAAGQSVRVRSGLCNAGYGKLDRVIVAKTSGSTE